MRWDPIIDTKRITRYYTGTNVSLPSITQDYIQLRRYTPRDPTRPPFQVFNFYLKSGGDFSFNTQLVSALLDVEPILTFVGGDLNFVERHEDTTSLTPRLPTSDFARAWAKFKDRFSLHEVEHDSHTYFHTTDDPLSPHFRSSRLDRFLVPCSLTSLPVFTPVVSLPHHPTNYSVSSRPHLRTFPTTFPSFCPF